jgi:hypothetical protein
MHIITTKYEVCERTKAQLTRLWFGRHFAHRFRPAFAVHFGSFPSPTFFDLAAQWPPLVLKAPPKASRLLFFGHHALRRAFCL